jgi:eukaryotic-like serine/threonine-protein kinase
MPREDFHLTGTKPIGRGAFGTVFAARRVSDDHPVAFKLVLHSGEWGPERIEAERKGAILQQRFASAHGMVPEVYDFGQDGDDFYIAMELIDGTSLEGLLRGGSLAPDDAAGHALWLCCFLEKAHAFSSVVDGKPYRIVHTDLKPAHLMIASSGDRKVLDFGIAKALEESRELGTDIGRTTAYASPERLVSDQVNAHADFWSLGVMLYEMVCGHRPYPHLDGPRFRRELERAIVNHEPRAALPDSCPPALGAIISKLLAFQVEHRYASAEEIRADLETFLRGEVPSAVAIYDTPATTPVRREAAARLLSLERSTVDVATSPTTPATTPRLTARVVPPTEPRLRTPDGESAEADSEGSPLSPVRTRSRVRRAARMAAAAGVLYLLTTEGIAFVFAERFRDTMTALDERTVTAVRDAYSGVDRLAVLDVGLGARVHRRLVPALVAVGDRVIRDYRREEPSMGPFEWAQASEALGWARELSSTSNRLRGMQLTAAGHVKRFEAQAARGSAATLLSQEALRIFRQAAEADPESFDPWLGIARIQLYSLSDVDAAAKAIDEAASRGYVPGRRESAMLGDGYLRRGLATRKRAGVLTGEQRFRELTSAREDFQRCVTFFDPIVAFGDSAQNLEICKANLDRVDRQLDGYYQET